jgi:hypothetical protein
MADEFDPQRDLFVSECMRLETFIRMYISTGFSDREVCSVLIHLTKELLSRQDDPEAARQQFIESLMEKC